ncbi:response regulator [Caballeronia pedi]|uniref:response regulator n=1 Tax=Caballeronia pedi TaxID=1777141 RepID=UPI00077246FB|nr:response regulator [Caballeronia pedi]
MVRVLIVDDEPAISDSLSIILGDAGYDVKCAVDGQAALQEATVWKPDVILSDLNMPRMGGEELLRQVRQTRALAHVPLVAMSALAPTPGLSFAGFLHKPFSVLAMLALVRRILCSPPSATPCIKRRAPPHAAGIAARIFLQQNLPLPNDFFRGL